MGFSQASCLSLALGFLASKNVVEQRHIACLWELRRREEIVLSSQC